MNVCACLYLLNRTKMILEYLIQPIQPILWVIEFDVHLLIVVLLFQESRR